uniref:Ig-like domain-containing protein n=1 Tax=Catagonus wagneri TaxID=51154 RepID=A0A8C3WSA3_9CETA
MQLLVLLLPLLVQWGGEWGRGEGTPLGGGLELQQNVTVQEGLCVQVPCTFSYPWGSFGTTSVSWFRKGAGRKRDLLVATNKLGQKLHEGSQGRFFLLGDPQANNCSLSIRDVNAGDSGTYFFQMEVDFRKHAYRDKPLSLEVTALSLTPHILVPESLESGRPSNLTCAVPWACEGGTPPIFSWTSAALTSLGPRTALSSVVTLTPRPQDHGASLTCQVMLPASGVTVERTVRLNASFGRPSPSLSAFLLAKALKIRQNASSLPVLEGQALQLRCVADGNPPVQLSWFRGSPAPKATPISGTATLELPDVGTVAGEVTCRAQNPLGSRNLSLSLSVVCECGDPWGQNTCIRGWGWASGAWLATSGILWLVETSHNLCFHCGWHHSPCGLVWIQIPPCEEDTGSSGLGSSLMISFRLI